MERTDSLLFRVLTHVEYYLLGKGNAHYKQTDIQYNLHCPMVVSGKEWGMEYFSGGEGILIPKSGFFWFTLSTKFMTAVVSVAW